MNVAEQASAALVALGVHRVYGLPGEDHMTLLHALHAAGIDYCAAFNESSAALMAATDAQLTGQPGVVVLSLAPGISNAMNGLLHAFMDRVPLVVISGQHPAASQALVVRQACDLERLVA